MIPFTLCCSTCKEFSYRGKKFNSRKEIIQDQTYLGIHMHRFFIKCPRCASEICFRTDPETADYKVRRRKFSVGFLGYGGQGSLLRGLVLWVLGLEDLFLGGFAIEDGLGDGRLVDERPDCCVRDSEDHSNPKTVMFAYPSPMCPSTLHPKH